MAIAGKGRKIQKENCNTANPWIYPTTMSK